MSAPTNLDPVLANVRAPVVVAGSFTPNGSGAVSSSTVKGARFTVARAGVGVMRITFRDSFPDMIYAHANSQADVSLSVSTKTGPYNAANRTLDIYIVDSSNLAADLASTNNARINFCAWFKNTSARN